MPRFRSSTIALVALGAAALSAAGTDAAAAKSSPLKVSVRAPKPVARDHSATLKVTVTNRTRRRLGALTLSASRPSGTSVTLVGARKGKLKRSLKTLGARRHTTISLRVKPGTKAKKSSTVAVAVRRHGRVAARAKTTVKIAAPANPYVGRYFWRSNFNGTTSYLEGYWFPNGRFAYRGIPDGGLPTCTAATATGDNDGCVPYTYDKATKGIKVGGAAGVPAGALLLKIGDYSYEEAAIPSAGTRWDVSGEYINSYGLCPSFCSFVTVGLKMTGAGAFARSSTVSGSTPDGSFAALPPDQHGTYAIQSAGRIVFTYASGKVTTETLGVLLDKADNPDPNYGILLDDSVFFGPKSDV